MDRWDCFAIGTKFKFMICMCNFSINPLLGPWLKCDMFLISPALFCDFYNPIGECEWHYNPCGYPCMKTCKNPSGTCSSQIPALEGN